MVVGNWLADLQGKSLVLLQRRRPRPVFLLHGSGSVGGDATPPPRGAEMIQFHLGPIGLVSKAPVKVSDVSA